MLELYVIGDVHWDQCYVFGKMEENCVPTTILIF
jgi:hypothetical protein